MANTREYAYRPHEGRVQEARGYRDAGASATARPARVSFDRYQARNKKRKSRR